MTINVNNQLGIIKWAGSGTTPANNGELSWDGSRFVWMEGSTLKYCDQTITLTTDVTGTGTGSFATTIAAGVVTYAKIQNVSATDKLLGRISTGAGSVEEISCTAAGRALLDDAAASDQRTTLGLGNSSTLNVGTTSGTVAAGDDSRWQSISSGGYVSRVGTNLVFKPDISNKVYLYESSVWTSHTIPDAGISVSAISLSDATNYYLYVYDSSGTLTLTLNTTVPTTQNGIQVMTGFTDRLLLATCYSMSSSILTYENTASRQGLCNIYNKRRIILYRIESTASWTYSSSTWRSSNNSSNNCLHFVAYNSAVTAKFSELITNSGGSYGAIGIALNVTNTTHTSPTSNCFTGTTSLFCLTTIYQANISSNGYNYLQATEAVYNGGTCTYGGAADNYGFYAEINA